jgi:hypothetical protein
MTQLSIKNIGLFLLLVLIFSSAYGQQADQVIGADQSYAYYLGKTKPLRELAPVAATPQIKLDQTKANRPSYGPKNFLGYDGPDRVNPLARPFGLDPVIQKTLTGGRMIEPLLVVEGINEAEADNVQVPDVNGDKGRDQYIQIVNASWMQIFSNDGTELTAPFNANVIWNEIGESSFSDPVIQYDEVADRWLVTDLAGFTEVLYAVSVTNDPLGSYYAYKYLSSGIVDYPKYGITPTAYVFTVNEGEGFFPVFAINRPQMLSGQSMVDVQRIEIPGIDGSFPTLTPVDWNGTLAPSTEDIQVVRVNDDAWGNGNSDDVVELWNINVDWADASNTTSELLQIVTEPFDADPCDGGQTCINQMGSTQELDAIATIVMNKVVYRNFGSHESIVLNFTVNPGNDVSGIRWMELRKSAAEDWDIYQEGTIAPDDGLNRWLGSIAINAKGSIGIAYAVAGVSKFPSLRFTGRLEVDPLGTMTIDEYEFATGSSARIQSNRYGDYFAMTVDPLTDAFWFTGEYMLNDGIWGTKIMSFATQKDTNDLSVRAMEAPSDGPDLTDTERIKVKIVNSGLNAQSNFSVGYIFENGSAVVESADVLVLESDSTYIHTFLTTEDLSLNGTYNFTFFVEPVLDENSANDTLRTSVQNLANLDLGLLSFSDLRSTVCESQVDLHVICQNFGADVLDSFTLGYQLNGGPVQLVHWFGSLTYRSKTTVNFAVENLESGENEINIFPIALNGGLDEFPANDSLVGEVRALLDGSTVTLNLLTDFFPEETSWELSKNAELIYSGGPYPGQENELIQEFWCLQQDSCYTFRLSDSYGDGVINYFGQDGDYDILDSEGNVLASLMNADFGYEETNTFCLASCALEVNVLVTNESAAGASDGIIVVEVTSGAGPFEYSIDGGATFQNDPLFQYLAPDEYQVIVRAADSCEYMETARVEIFVTVGEIENKFDVSIAPNPSVDGVYKLHVGGLPQLYLPLEISILDVSGRSVTHQPIPRINTYHEGIVSLKNYPAGVYYFIIHHDLDRQLIRVIRL